MAAAVQKVAGAAPAVERAGRILTARIGKGPDAPEPPRTPDYQYGGPSSAASGSTGVSIDVVYPRVYYRVDCLWRAAVPSRGHGLSMR